MDTYVLETTHDCTDGSGSRERVQWLVRATDFSKAMQMTPGSDLKLVQIGSLLDQQAREAGIIDGGIVRL